MERIHVDRALWLPRRGQCLTAQILRVELCGLGYGLDQCFQILLDLASLDQYDAFSRGQKIFVIAPPFVKVRQFYFGSW